MDVYSGTPVLVSFVAGSLSMAEVFSGVLMAAGFSPTMFTESRDLARLPYNLYISFIKLDSVLQFCYRKVRLVHYYCNTLSVNLENSVGS